VAFTLDWAYKQVQVNYSQQGSVSVVSDYTMQHTCQQVSLSISHAHDAHSQWLVMAGRANYIALAAMTYVYY